MQSQYIRRPYLQIWKVTWKLLTQVAWELAVILGLRKYPCKLYFNWQPHALGQPAPITQITGKKLKIPHTCDSDKGTTAFSYPEPFLRAVNGARRGALAKSITGYHKNMVRKQYPVLELANHMPVRIWIWPEPLVAPRVGRALGTRMATTANDYMLTIRSQRHSTFGSRMVHCLLTLVNILENTCMQKPSPC